MTQSTRLQELLRWEIDNLQNWLDGFYPGASGRTRRAWLGRTGEYVVVEALPLPDAYAPDEIDVLLLVDNFPSLPPIGLYALNKGNDALIAQMRRRMNAFENQGYHSAASIPGYTWICYAYASNRWRYNAAAPNRGDNLRKFLASFYAELMA